MQGNKKIIAVGLLSGGLDSTLAAKLILEQGIEVYAVNFTSPFCTCTPKKSGCAAVVTAVKELGSIPLKRVTLRDDYLEIVRKPKYGYGSGMNPCLDCRIMKIQKAGAYMRAIGAHFLFTGEVLGQRPMSQHKRAMDIIENESGFEGYLLRPLSAAFFEPSIPEKKGWVDRSILLGISGRSRKTQISLAAEKDINDYPCPAGGCLLTDKNFSDKLRDYFRFTERPSIRDISLLKVGRHFWLASGDKVIIARNEDECKIMKNLCRENEHLLVPQSFPGPTVILQGHSIKSAVEKMLQYTKKSLPQEAFINHLYKRKTQILSLKEI
ncbi:MAG: tRNA 4-thiouridine(8) synthase ThiI [Desulfobacterales bacterium]